MSEIYGVGDQTILGWGVESTPGTAVAPTSYVPIDIGSSAPTFDPNRAAVDVAMGSPNVTIAVVDRKGKGTWSMAMQAFPVLGADFLAACGLSSTGLAAPSSLTLVQDYKGKKIQYPGSRATKILIKGDAQNGIVITVSGEFIARPIVGSPLSVPTVSGTNNDPFTYVDLGAVTLISGATTAMDLESFEISIDMPHALGYGNSGSPLPSVMALSRFGITGKLTVFFSDVNVAEYNAMIVADGLIGAINLPFSKTVGAETYTLDIALSHAKYQNGPLTAPKDGLDMLDLNFISFSPNLTNQITYTQTTTP